MYLTYLFQIIGHEFSSVLIDCHTYIDKLYIQISHFKNAEKHAVANIYINNHVCQCP